MTESDRTTQPPIAAYLEPMSARPGTLVSVMVSTEAARFDASLVRIISADPNPDGPGLKLAEVAADFAGCYPGRRQVVDLGSYGEVPADRIFARERLVARVRIQPWRLSAAPAVLVAARDPQGNGWGLEADAAGLRFRYRSGSGPEAVLLLPMNLCRRKWYRVCAGYDLATGCLMIGCEPLEGSGRAVASGTYPLKALPEIPALTVAATRTEGVSSGHFNGRIEAPRLDAHWPAQSDPLEGPEVERCLLAWWDLSRAMDSQAMIDVGPHGLHGRLVNVPTRAVRGSRWDGTEFRWRDAPEQYAAIHFHDDDLYDCRWQADFRFRIADNLASGVYGVRLTCEQGEEVCPLFVLPPRGTRGAAVCFVAPTFTYQAYANHARGNCDEVLRVRMAEWGAYAANPDDFPVFGRSTYNFHPDGSGHAFSSRHRPMLTLRPGFLTFADERGSGLRHFPADTQLLDWLEHKGIMFEVVTDDELHAEGAELIAGYPVVLTGTHPEYQSTETLDALQRYLESGGNLMYLGGNGFYWRTVLSPRLPGMIEIRRAEGGIRAWATEPGEAYHALDGTYGGLWRRNGRPPQALVCIGFSAQGLFEGSWYRRTSESRQPDHAWIFEGVEEDRLGDYGLGGGGAAGFELDRADAELGTPQGTVVLARSECHGPNFIAVPEELLTHIRTVSGESREALVRAEITWYETPAGGAVFSVGSITFCGSLSHNAYRNGISRMLENVLLRLRAGKVRQAADTTGIGGKA